MHRPEGGAPSLVEPAAQARHPIKFGLNELAGSMGDFGTLLPLAIGYIVVCGLDPAGFLVMMGLANIASGLTYRLPMPIEPMKALAVVAIAQAWAPSMVYASGFGMGVVWFVLAATGAITWVARETPKPVVMGIQVTLGVLISIEALKLSSASWLLAATGILIVLVLKDNKYAPAAIVLVVLGVVIMAFQGSLSGLARPEFRLPELSRFTPREVWQAFVGGGFAQIPLTTANAVIATSALIPTYFPGRQVSTRKLAFSHSAMNLVAPWFGGMPMCHGAGGLVGQYFYGARTAGANIIEGAIEILMGLFLAGSIVALFSAFPSAIVGAMMLMVGFELIKFVRHLRAVRDLWVLGATVVVALLTDMALGFVAGLIAHQLVTLVDAKRTDAR